jgi:MoaD family protein
VATVRLFAQARDAAGRRSDEIDASTVGEVIELARQRYGDDFANLLPTCQVWLNGQPADAGATVGPEDEVAVLPPVSGG